MNPDAAIAFYAKEFPSTSKTTWGGMTGAEVAEQRARALHEGRPTAGDAAADRLLALRLARHQRARDDGAAARRRRDAAAALHRRRRPHGQHQQRHVSRHRRRARPDAGRSSTDAKKNNVKPAGGAGFAYVRGPDDALIEVQGDMPAERFNHVHMYHEEPFCSQLWYQKHLNVPIPQGRRGGAPAEPRTEANCKVPRGPDKTWPALDVDGMYRAPQIPLVFGDVSMGGYTRQTDAPLVSTRGHLADHVALSVADLDAWVTKLRAENVTFLEQTLQARRHPRDHDRRSQPRSARAGRGQVNENPDCPVGRRPPARAQRSGVGADRFLRPLDARQRHERRPDQGDIRAAGHATAPEHRRLFRRWLRPAAMAAAVRPAAARIAAAGRR